MSRKQYWKLEDVEKAVNKPKSKKRKTVIVDSTHSTLRQQSATMKHQIIFLKYKIIT